MSQTSKNLWLDGFDLGCALAAVILLIAFPQLGGWPLLVGVIPWFLRLGQHQPIFRRTLFDLPLVIFILTAAIGVWAAYQPQSAWIKFWLIVAAALLYLAIARQPKQNLWWLAGFLATFGIVIALVFIFGWNWQVHPSDVPAVNRIMLKWMDIRPDLFSALIHPNDDDVSGIVAISLPFMLAWGWRIWRSKSVFLKIVSILAAALLFLVLVIATSRSAWLAIAAALGSLGLWFVVKSIFKRKTMQVRTWFIAALILIGIVSLSISIQYPQLLNRVMSILPGPAQLDGRLELIRNSFPLIGDFPFTGGGLNGFSGQYSRYVLGIPFDFIATSHNLYVDSAIEQGIFGAIALIWIFLGSLWTVLSPQMDRISLGLKYAVFASLLFLIFFGLPENITLTTQNVLLLFILPGMVSSMAQPPETRPLTAPARWKIPLAAGIGIILFLVVVFDRNLQAAWFADLGTVKMARVELAGFPTGKWEESTKLVGLADAISLFNRSLEINPANRTANYRMGLLNLQQRDFESSTKHLETAILQGASIYGIRKSLGLSYAWEGKLDSAVLVLKSIPVARGEMNVYSWWWVQQGRPDLAENARLIATALAAGG